MAQNFLRPLGSQERGGEDPGQVAGAAPQPSFSPAALCINIYPAPPGCCLHFTEEALRL